MLRHEFNLPYFFASFHAHSGITPGAILDCIALLRESGWNLEGSLVVSSDYGDAVSAHRALIVGPHRSLLKDIASLVPRPDANAGRFGDYIRSSLNTPDRALDMSAWSSVVHDSKGHLECKPWPTHSVFATGAGPASAEFSDVVFDPDGPCPELRAQGGSAFGVTFGVPFTSSVGRTLFCAATLSEYAAMFGIPDDLPALRDVDFAQSLLCGVPQLTLWAFLDVYLGLYHADHCMRGAHGIRPCLILCVLLHGCSQPRMTGRVDTTTTAIQKQL